MLKNSLKSPEAFRTVYRDGKSFANKDLVMYVLPNGSDGNRVGISVSKKVGNSVVRHRLTRLIRESYRLQSNVLKQGYDIVIIARARAKGKNYHVIAADFMHLCKLHKIISEAAGEQQD